MRRINKAKVSMKEKQAAPSSSSKFSPKRLILMAIAGLFGLGAIGVLVLVFALAMAYPNLPALDTITDYRPKMPLRIFTADNVLIGEFGEERRTLVHFKDIPDVMKKAVLSIEDDRFYEHSGIDYLGILRAAFRNATGGARQGASTITQQVARNFFLSSEQTFKRKAYEALLAWKIEKNLTKDQILELYMNQIYLGQRAFGSSRRPRSISARTCATSPWPKRPCWPACRRRRRPTIQSSIRPAPRPASNTSCSACTRSATSTTRNSPRRRKSRSRSRPTAPPSACMPNTSPRWRASWSTSSSRKTPIPAA
jgi:hypothetical protein